MHSYLEIRNTNRDASSATILKVADEYHLCTALRVIQEQEQPSTNPVEEFGYFVNATLLQKRNAIIHYRSAKN